MIPGEFDFGQFYAVGENFTTGAIRLDCLLPSGVDPADLTRGTWTPSQPLRCNCEEGTRWVDLLGTTHAVLRIVSGSVIETFRANDLDGWDTYPVEISCKDQNLAGYEGLIARGRCGPVHHEEVLMPSFVPGGEPIEGSRGVYFDPATWDGSDIFSPEGTGLVIVTQRVKDALEHAGMENWSFVSLPAWAVVRL